MSPHADPARTAAADRPCATRRPGFDPQERHLLLRMPRIGVGMIDRLEAAGFTSLRALREAGTAGVIDHVAAQVRQGAWLNRRRALDAAIARLVAAAGDRRDDVELSR